MMKGYINLDLLKKYEPVEESALVGCKKCGHSWYEKYTFTSAVRINGPMYFYDYCDVCIDKDGSRNEAGF